MHCWQKLIAVAEMVLAELTGGIAERFQRLRDGDVLGAETQRSGWQADFGHSGAKAGLPGDERCSTRRAALLGIVIGEHQAFMRDAVDVRRLIAHQAE